MNPYYLVYCHKYKNAIIYNNYEVIIKDMEKFFKDMGLDDINLGVF